jgi:hypothetical protein
MSEINTLADTPTPATISPTSPRDIIPIPPLMPRSHLLLAQSSKACVVKVEVMSINGGGVHRIKEKLHSH